MIEIQIRMVPRGMREEERPIGRVFIVNDGTGTETKGNYNVAFSTILPDRRVRVWKSGKIKNHPRKAKSVWKLVKAAFDLLEE